MWIFGIFDFVFFFLRVVFKLGRVVEGVGVGYVVRVKRRFSLVVVYSDNVSGGFVFLEKLL